MEISLSPLLFSRSSNTFGAGKHLFDDFYVSMSVNGIYHAYTNNKTQELDFGINPELVYVLDKENKRILINLSETKTTLWSRVWSGLKYE